MIQYDYELTINAKRKQHVTQPNVKPHNQYVRNVHKLYFTFNNGTTINGRKFGTVIHNVDWPWNKAKKEASRYVQNYPKNNMMTYPFMTFR